MKSRYICPVCKGVLFEEDRLYHCENNHSFDKSAEGYVNLGAVKGAGETSGDAADTCRARHEFLEKDYYKPLADEVCRCINEYAPIYKSKFVIDAGCGEGYYSRQIKKQVHDSEIYGIDLAKQGVRLAAKAEKREENKIHFAVAGIFDMPFGDGEAAAVVSVFAPVAAEENARVLTDDGILVVACPGKDHLIGLKKALYDVPTENDEKIPEYDNFTLIDTRRVTYNMHLDGDTAAYLFAMTPYFWRSSAEVREKSKHLGDVVTPADFIVKVYRKTAE